MQNSLVMKFSTERGPIPWVVLLIFKKDHPEIKNKVIKDYFYPHCPHVPLELAFWQAATHQ
ncbi:hypothetical protein [Coxiella-like endosymbiont]|uniref:hypothetical protein n=1 Tax=Coxiella-like endosymbiont TaxID=1592897 RepID=UPI00272B2A8A|nr:hypothetical protein [Coxiella-like endosymbiont]